MRLLRSVSAIMFATAISLAYVHQQVEHVKISYAIEAKEKKVSLMLDRRDSLGYNIDNMESPSRLEQVLSSQKIDVAFPGRKQTVNYAGAGRTSIKGNIRPLGVENKVSPISGFLDFFSPKAEAQVKEQ